MKSDKIIEGMSKKRKTKRKTQLSQIRIRSSRAVTHCTVGVERAFSRVRIINS